MNEHAFFWLRSPLATALISWFVAQLIKVIIILITDKKLDMSRFIGSGGMPSSHSAIVCSLTTAIGLTNGFSSAIFALSTVTSLIVMYDAAGVRRAAGQQAKILNKIIADWEKEDYTKTGEKLKELLGHSPKEVSAGALLGILIGIIRHI